MKIKKLDFNYILITLIILSFIKYRLEYVEIANLFMLIYSMLFMIFQLFFYKNIYEYFEINEIKRKYINVSVIFNYFMLALVNSSSYMNDLVLTSSLFRTALIISKIMFFVSILFMIFYVKNKRHYITVIFLLLIAVLNFIEIFSTIEAILYTIMYIYILIINNICRVIKK